MTTRQRYTKLGRKRVFRIKMVLLIFTAIMEALADHYNRQDRMRPYSNKGSRALK